MRNLNRLIVPKMLKGWTPWDFFNIHSVEYQKNERGPFEDIERFPKKITKPKKRKRGTCLLWSGFVFHARGFGCGQNHVLIPYGITVHRQAILLLFVESGTRKLRKVVESRTKFLFDVKRVLDNK